MAPDGDTYFYITNASPGSMPGETHSILKAGSKAPAFTLKSTPDQTVSLRDFLGRPVVLAFYPADWSPVCSDQMGLYAQVMPEFKKFDAEVMGISVDGVWSHLAFAKDRKLNFPLLSDFEPKGAVSKAYGVYESARRRVREGPLRSGQEGDDKVELPFSRRRQSRRGRDTDRVGEASRRLR